MNVNQEQHAAPLLQVKVMSSVKEPLEKTKKTPIPDYVVVRKTRVNPVKVMLRWLYWLLLIGVTAAVVLSSLDTGLSMYKGLN